MKLLERVDGIHRVSESTPDFLQMYDIIVCGAGTAGIIAALTAARMELRVLCIETGTFPGGMGTGIVMGYYHGDHLNGQCKALDEEAIQLSDQICCRKKAWCEGIHAEAKKLVYEAAYKKAGGVLWYESITCGVWAQEGGIQGLRILTDGMLQDIACQMVIDATSEANICRLAGLPVRMGRKSDGQAQAFSAVCLVMNEEGELEHVYRDNGFLSNGDMLQVSSAVTQSYAQSDAQGAYSKSCRNQMLLCGALVGKREGLHGTGLAAMTGEMLFGEKTVPQPIFTMSGPYDTHLYDAAFESALVNDFLLRGLRDKVLTAQVPYGALIAQGIQGLLMVGLSMDIEHDALPPVRLKKNAMRSGEAAAVAAGLAVKLGKYPEECYESVRNEMLRRGLLQDSIQTMQWRDIKMPPIPELKKYSNAQAVYLIGKQNRGEDTGWLLPYLEEKEDYSLFCYALEALIESSLRGDAKAAEAVLELVDDEAFSRQLELNGYQRKTVLERRGVLRTYVHRKLGKTEGSGSNER